MIEHVIILAGGRGTRLAPYTTVLPKPLMPVGDVPILEIVIRQLAAHGLKHIVVATGYLGALIEAYFGTGEQFGADICYSTETEPLGTAGPIGLARSKIPRDDILVMNGDLLADVDYTAMVLYHQTAGNALTIGAHLKTHHVDLGVLDVDADGQLLGYREKPVHQYLVSMGIYVMQPAVVDMVRGGERCDLPDLVLRVLRDGQRVGIYRHEGTWLDIGRPEDFREAVALYESDPSRFLRRVHNG